MILVIRTDQPEAEVALINSEDFVESYVWQAHRELSDTLLIKIEDLLIRSDVAQNELTGIAVYRGPGSFTGLRIGITVANTLAYALGIPIWGLSEDEWDSLPNLTQPVNPRVVIPEYGQEATITKPRK